MEVKEKNKALGIKRAFEEAGWRPLRRRPSLPPGGAQPLPWDKLRGRAPAAAKGPNPLDLPALSATPRAFATPAG